MIAAIVLLGAGWTSSDDRLQSLLMATGRIAGLTCLIAIPVGVALAMLLSRTDIVARRWLWMFLVLWLLMPLYVQVAGWESFAGKLGWWTLRSGTLANAPLAGEAAVVWIHAVAAIPWVVLFVFAGLATLDPAWEEQLLTRHPWPVALLRGTLPLLTPFVLLATAWTFLVGAGEMTVTNIYMVRSYAEEIYTTFALANSLRQVMSLAAPGLAVLAAMIVGLFAFLPPLAIVARTSGRIAGETSRPPFCLRGLRLPLSLVAWGVVILAWGVPLVSLLHRAGMEVTGQGSQLEREWSEIKCAVTLAEAPNRFRAEIADSLSLAVLATLSALAVIAWPAWIAARRNDLWFPALLLLLQIIPGPVVGTLVILLLNQPADPTGILIWAYDRTLLAPTLALWFRVIPVAGGILWLAFRQTPRETWEQTRVHLPQGARRGWAMQFGVHRYAWLTACAAGMAIALGDLSATILVLPPGVSTVSHRVFGLLHAGCDDQAAAISYVMLLLTVVAGMVATACWPVRPSPE